MKRIEPGIESITGEERDIVSFMRLMRIFNEVCIFGLLPDRSLKNEAIQESRYSDWLIANSPRFSRIIRYKDAFLLSNVIEYHNVIECYLTVADKTKRWRKNMT